MLLLSPCIFSGRSATQLLTAIFLLGPAFSLAAQVNAFANSKNSVDVTTLSELQETLAHTGFENVRVIADGPNKAVVSYEDRLYRSQVRGLAQVIRIALPYLASADSATFVIQKLGWPIATIEADVGKLQTRIGKAFSPAEFSACIRFVDNHGVSDSMRSLEPAANTSFAKVEVGAVPKFDTQLGNREDAFKFKADLDAWVSTTLTRGLTLRSVIRVPLVNEIDAFDKESTRLYSANMGYVRPLGQDLLLNSNVGYFGQERYGVSAQVCRYLQHGDLAFSLRGDLTGFLAYHDHKWFYSDLNSVTYNAQITYLFTKFAFRATISYGRFLRSDRGVKATFGRYFRETRFEFFGVATNKEHWAGVTVRLPLFPGKRLKPRAFRVNLPNTYQFRYDYVTTDYARSFDLENDLSDFRTELSRTYFLSHLYEFQQ